MTQLAPEAQPHLARLRTPLPQLFPPIRHLRGLPLLLALLPRRLPQFPQHHQQGLLPQETQLLRPAPLAPVARPHLARLRAPLPQFLPPIRHLRGLPLLLSLLYRLLPRRLPRFPQHHQQGLFPQETLLLRPTRLFRLHPMAQLAPEVRPHLARLRAPLPQFLPPIRHLRGLPLLLSLLHRLLPRRLPQFPQHRQQGLLPQETQLHRPTPLPPLPPEVRFHLMAQPHPARPQALFRPLALLPPFSSARLFEIDLQDLPLFGFFRSQGCLQEMSGQFLLAHRH